jgi:hypothetical protein
MRGRLLSGKKGQIYPVFLAVFTLVVLGYAYVAISHSKEIYNPDDSKAYIGQKQMQVYYTLMEAEGVKSFVQLSAIIAAQNSYEGMRLSCTYPESASTAKGSEDWACGSYIYPLWSNSGETCAPDCELSLASKFSEELKRELAKHELATGKRITDDYSLRFSSGKEHYNISGVSRSKIVFESNIIEPDLALAQSLRRFLESRYSINPSFTVTVNKQVESPSSIGECLHF